MSSRTYRGWDFRGRFLLSNLGSSLAHFQLRVKLRGGSDGLAARTKEGRSLGWLDRFSMTDRCSTVWGVVSSSYRSRFRRGLRRRGLHGLRGLCFWMFAAVVLAATSSVIINRPGSARETDLALGVAHLTKRLPTFDGWPWSEWDVTRESTSFMLKHPSLSTVWRKFTRQRLEGACDDLPRATKSSPLGSRLTKAL